MINVIDAMSVAYAGYFSGQKSRKSYKKAIAHFIYTSISPLDPTYVCWEGFKSTVYRKDLNENYKSNREWDPEVRDAIKSLKEICEEYNYMEISADGFEADDTIMALCKYLKNQGESVKIISRDRDLLQAVQKGYADAQFDFVQKINLEVPSYDIVKYKALVGDVSDCIKGVSKIGKKRALGVLAGSVKLSESQEREFEEALKLVDIESLPKFDHLYNSIGEALNKKEGRIIHIRVS